MEVDVVKRKIAGQKQALKKEAHNIGSQLSLTFDFEMSQRFKENLEKKREDILYIAKVLLSFCKKLEEINGQFYWLSVMNNKMKNILLKKYKKRIEKTAERSVISEQEHEEFVAELERFQLRDEFWKMRKKW